VAPKFDPVIVTELPNAPDVGFRPEILGLTVKLVPALAAPPTVTTTFPVVAPLGTGTTMLVEFQLVGVEGVPLNVTVLLPSDGPKPPPVMVTAVPATPEEGLKLAMVGMTGKSAPLLETPPTVTTTLPVDAPMGTGTVMMSRSQSVGVAGTPLKVTVLVPCGAPKPPP